MNAAIGCARDLPRPENLIIRIAGIDEGSFEIRSSGTGRGDPNAIDILFGAKIQFPPQSTPLDMAVVSERFGRRIPIDRILGTTIGGGRLLRFITLYRRSSTSNIATSGKHLNLREAHLLMFIIRIVIENLNVLHAAGRATWTFVGPEDLRRDLVHFGILWRRPRQLEPDRSAMDTMPDTNAVPLASLPMERLPDSHWRTGIALVVVIEPIMDRHVIDHHLRPVVVLHIELVASGGRCLNFS